MKFLASLLFLFFLASALEVPTRQFLSEAPSLRALVIQGDIRLSPRDETSTEDLEGYADTRVNADFITSVPAHFLCTAKFSFGTAASATALMQKGQAPVAVATTAATSIRDYAKNPLIGYSSSRTALLSAVSRAANYALYRIGQGRTIPKSAMAALERAAAITKDYGLGSYFVDACSINSKGSSTLSEVLKLANYAIETMKDLPEKDSELRSVPVDSKPSLGWMRLSSALVFLESYDPAYARLLRLEAQFSDGSGYGKIEKRAYSQVLSALSERCSSSEAMSLLKKAESALADGELVFFHKLAGELSRIDCRNPIEMPEHQVQPAPLEVRRHFSCYSDGGLKNCTFEASVTNPNSFLVVESVELHRGVFEDVSSDAFVVGNSIIADVELQPKETRAFSGSFVTGGYS